MKWFKHYTDASRSEKLAALMDKTGVEGYGRYWLLVEFLAEKFDGNETEFLVNKKTLGRHLGYYRPTMARHWLDIGETLGLFRVSMLGQCHSNDDSNYLIVFPKLLEIKDNHTKNLQASNKSLAPREEKKRKEKIYSKQDEKNVPETSPKKCNKLHQEILSLWNGNASNCGMPSVKTLSPARTKKLNVACKMFKDIEDWRKIFNVTATKFFVGSDGRQFIPNWDYIFRNENYVKFFEEYEADLDTSSPEKEMSEQEIRTLMGL